MEGCLFPTITQFQWFCHISILADLMVHQLTGSPQKALSSGKHEHVIADSKPRQVGFCSSQSKPWRSFQRAPGVAQHVVLVGQSPLCGLVSSRVSHCREVCCNRDAICCNPPLLKARQGVTFSWDQQRALLNFSMPETTVIFCSFPAVSLVWIPTF